MKKPAYYILIRSYQDAGFVSVWLCRNNGGGGGYSGLLHGEMLPRLAEEIAEATGLPVEREGSTLAKVKPMTKPGCVPVPEQPSLFPEAPCQ